MLVALSDVIALVEGLEAEPRGTQKVWIQEPSTSRLIARLRALPQVEAPQPAPAPALVHGLDAQAWYDTASRYHAGLRVIAHTKGNSLTLAWAQAQALHYLGAPLAGTKVWAMPETDDQVQVVVPDSVVIPARIQPMPPPNSISLKPGQFATVTLEKPADANAG